MIAVFALARQQTWYQNLTGPQVMAIRIPRMTKTVEVNPQATKAMDLLPGRLVREVQPGRGGGEDGDHNEESKFESILWADFANNN